MLWTFQCLIQLRGRLVTVSLQEGNVNKLAGVTSFTFRRLHVVYSCSVTQNRRLPSFTIAVVYT